MKHKDEKERRSLRHILSTPQAKKVLRIAGWTLTALAALYLVILALVILLQPADRAFVRKDEWIAIALLALPALVILLIGLFRFLHRKKELKK